MCLGTGRKDLVSIGSGRTMKLADVTKGALIQRRLILSELGNNSGSPEPIRVLRPVLGSLGWRVKGS